ncbi:sulfotransferase domain-containing protein [Alkalihalobacterium chitinilyticum]|uniref:Sulfotransferase domain-containing protein n=1 Tax=Alkalihalobacterium chitinilyticum TaxID=2980103 RepID=A0ABT5VBZ9_9BACI|nr:sulfotransferase domain-containing protein [Alkalihalobacterium chitinilyticum]MDE5412681.1 sulfotransferase domain-containing protein [Alkalihalobacterium chitinilyticum]
MNLPNFLIIGAQKCGTTWLYDMLNQHPEVYMAKKKELEFFSYSKNNLGDIKNYTSNFLDANGKTAIGEATPSYFWNANNYSKWNFKPNGFEKDIPKQVHETLGSSTKLVLLLRNPIERAVSAYFHHCKKNRISFQNDLLDVGKYHGIIHMGFYYEHLVKWFEFFNPENFLIIIYETDIKENSKETLKRTFNFLNVTNTFMPINHMTEIHKGMSRVKIDNNYYVSIDSKSGIKHQQLVVNKQTRKKLKEIYSEDILKLSNLLNKELVTLWQ